jgi:hypothetical protein
MNTAAASAWLAGLSDRLDPMLVRCVRQDLRSKIFVGVFCLLLLVSASAALIAATSAGATADPDRPYGRHLFLVLAWCWSFCLIVVQSAATHRLVAQERNDDTWDLVELTGLPPRRIVRGLLLASLTQSALYTAAMTPFLVMAYLLRGLDLLTILAALVTVPLLGILAASIALFLACAAPGKKARAAGGGVILLLMLFGWGLTSGIQFNEYEGLASLLRGLSDGATWAWMGTGIGLNAWAGTVWLLLVLAATLLSHRAEDRSTRPRLAIAALWLNVVLWLVGALWYLAPSAKVQASLAAGVGLSGAFLTIVSGFFAMTEDWELTPRQARAVSEQHGWRRTLSALLGPGGARGRWFTLALAASVTLLLVPGWNLTSDSHKLAVFAWMTLGYGLLLVLVGDAVARTLLGRWCTQASQRRLVILGVASAWSILPVLAALVVTENGVGFAALRLLTPGWAVYYYALEEPGAELAVILLLLPLAVAGWAAFQAVRHRTVVTRRVLAGDGDRNPRT